MKEQVTILVRIGSKVFDLKGRPLFTTIYYYSVFKHCMEAHN
jgi:hypothetical protein